MYVYGIGMEDNPTIEEPIIRKMEYDTYQKKKFVIVISDKPREE